MADNTLKTRIQLKNDTEANWNQATNFTPKKGEVIIYSVDSTHTHPRIKIGDGTTTVVNLPFIDAATASNVNLSGVVGADDLRAIEALSGTSGLLKKTAANNWSLDTTNYITKLNSSIDNAIVRFNGTSGQIKNSSVIINDNGIIKTLGTYVHRTSIVNQSGYIKFLTLTVLQTYINRGFEISYTTRSRLSGSIHCIFSNANNKDPDLTIYKTGTANIYYIKSTTSTWDIYINKSENYEDCIFTIINPGQLISNDLTSTWVSEHVTTLPEGYLTATKFTQTMNISGNATNVTETVAIANGGTGKTTATEAWTALGGGASGKHEDTYFIKAITSTTYGIPRFNGTTGQVKNSQVTIDDSNNVIIPGSLTIYRETTTSANASARITFTNKDTTNNQTNSGYIAYYNDHSTSYNGNLIIHSTGNTFIGGGESAGNLYATLGSTISSENLYLSADTAVYIEGSADTIANRMGIGIVSGNVIPIKAEAGNNNVQSLGTSAVKWANVYATTLHGTLATSELSGVVTTTNKKFLKDTGDWVQVDWADLTGKPTSFSPATHNHSQIVTAGDNRSVATTPNDYKNALIFQGLKSSGYIGNPSTNNYSYVVGLRGWSDSSGGDSHEFAFNNNGINWRHGATTTWSEWKTIAYTDSTVAQAIADASGNTITSTYAPLASPALTGTPTAPTAANGTNTTQIATTAFVNNTLAYINSMQFKGTIGTDGTITALPATHNAGDTYRVITADTYAGKYCEVGTLIICVKDGSTAADADWTSVETNEDGSVIGPTSSIANQVPKFSSNTGRIITNSGVTIDGNNNVTIPGTALKVTAEAGAKYILIGNQNSQGVDCPVILQGVNGSLYIGNGTSWSSSTGGTLNTALFMSKARKIGIGTTIPVTELDVNGTTTALTYKITSNATITYNSISGCVEIIV